MSIAKDTLQKLNEFAFGIGFHTQQEKMMPCQHCGAKEATLNKCGGCNIVHRKGFIHLKDDPSKIAFLCKDCANKELSKWSLKKPQSESLDELEESKTEIWYMKPEHTRDLMMGHEFVKRHAPHLVDYQKDPQLYKKTHIKLTDTDKTDLDDIYHHYQGHVWSPNGEAKPIIRSKGLKHTSMSVGDIAIVKGRPYMVDSVGFKHLIKGEEK
jgi:hypothetical protein